MNKKLFGLSVCALATAFSYAQKSDSLSVKNLQEVVVSDTKFVQSREKSGKVIDVITAQELEQKKGQSLANVLHQIAGVEINGNQSFSGKNLGYYIRGGRNRQTAIYIDGIPVIDASGINLEYDLRLISIDQIEKIEIMKGASSTLYGSGAATGVINITLKKSAQSKIKGSAYSTLGTQNTTITSKMSAQDLSQGFALNGTVNKVTYLTSLNSNVTNGMSEAAGDNFEEDSFSRVNLMQKVGFKANSKLGIEVFGTYDRIKNTFDNSFDGIVANSDDVNNSNLSEQFRIGFLPRYTYKNGEFAINTGLSAIDRKVQMTNTWTNTIDNYNYSGRTVSMDVFNKYAFAPLLFIVVGTQYQYYDMIQKDPYAVVSKNQAKFNLFDPYATMVFNSEFGLNLNLGARLNTHSEYGKQLVYNFNPSYAFANLPLKVMASYSTAYITPSLYQLYGPYGNTALTPEENATAEIGFESQMFEKRLTINTIGFYRVEENAIGFFYDAASFESYYVNNNGRNNAKGIESTVRFRLSKQINFAGNYTFTQVDETLNRLIPKHKVNLEVNYKFKRGNLGWQYQFVDQRKDAYYDANIWATQSTNLSAYQLINATFSYELLSKRLHVFSTITNVMNESFQEVIGYNTRGRNYKLGLNFLF